MIVEMATIILRYNNLLIPQQFVPAVELFKLSAETQLESDKYMIEWVSTGDDTAHIRSDQILHQSFEYEQAALLEFNLAAGDRQTHNLFNYIKEDLMLKKLSLFLILLNICRTQCFC